MGLLSRWGTLLARGGHVKRGGRLRLDLWLGQPRPLGGGIAAARWEDVAMTTKRQTVKQGTGSWYTERGTYTEPSEVPGTDKLMRAGKFIAFVPSKAA